MQESLFTFKQAVIWTFYCNKFAQTFPTYCSFLKTKIKHMNQNTTLFCELFVEQKVTGDKQTCSFILQ